MITKKEEDEMVHAPLRPIVHVHENPFEKLPQELVREERREKREERGEERRYVYNQRTGRDRTDDAFFFFSP